MLGGVCVWAEGSYFSHFTPSPACPKFIDLHKRGCGVSENFHLDNPDWVNPPNNNPPAIGIFEIGVQRGAYYLCIFFRVKIVPKKMLQWPKGPFLGILGCNMWLFWKQFPTNLIDSCKLVLFSVVIPLCVCVPSPQCWEGGVYFGSRSRSSEGGSL